MKTLFYLFSFIWILTEIANVYFIMPMPGSQQSNSISLAYGLYNYRWIWRTIYIGVLIYTFQFAWLGWNRYVTTFVLLLLAGIIYATNFYMAADAMFLQMKHIVFKQGIENKVPMDKLILGIQYNGIAKAYPIQFLGYHHQVVDEIGGKPIMVTYCTVCRTGRVFEPMVNGKVDSFRLVGMDHFNAMFEDATTKSWWRQANGECIAGEMKGSFLPEMESAQMELSQWLKLYPESFVIQADTTFNSAYEQMLSYENGHNRGTLTNRDSGSWNRKSWVVGIELNGKSKAYDWLQLKKERIIHDVLNQQPIVIVLANDDKSFMAFKRKSEDQKFEWNGSILSTSNERYDIMGNGLDSNTNLLRLRPHQEYWHSWKEFHPNTERY